MRVDFVANASHELRTPLATIIGYAETLAEDGRLDDDARRRFGATIHGEAARMLRIVEDLMSLSRIEADRFVAPRDAVDLGEIARHRRRAGRGRWPKRKGCTIDVDGRRDLPPVRGDHRPVAAAGRQSGRQRDALWLRPGTRRGPDRGRAATATRAVLRVRDQGEGIAADHLPRLTERFYRVDAARSRDSGGTGLGLAIVKHIVERHRGTLDIRSAPGQRHDVEVHAAACRR